MIETLEYPRAACYPEDNACVGGTLDGQMPVRVGLREVNQIAVVHTSNPSTLEAEADTVL